MMYPRFEIDKEQPLYICGVPFEEAQKVLTIYRETGVSPTKDYAKGFEDGVKKCYEEFDNLFTKEFTSDGSQLFRSAAEGAGAGCTEDASAAEDDGAAEP